MQTQWYPGHMARARRAIAESMAIHDVVIEVLDARMPASSENPLIAELRREKPCIKVLCKSDLADPEVTAAWLRHLENAASKGPRPGGVAPGVVAAIALRTDRPAETRSRLPELCKRLARPTRQRTTVRAMVVGIPNVGKSTLVNTLMERKVAKVGDEPAVTKARQQVVLKSGMMLSDHPGILWPKIDDDSASLRLALGGALPDRALEYESVALFGAALLMERYPQRLLERYKLAEMPPGAPALLVEIGRRRGGLRSGGSVDLHKAADVLIHDFRSGALGRISLELPGAIESIEARCERGPASRLDR
jgi:ribosome biogenesis GTPase A